MKSIGIFALTLLCFVGPALGDGVRITQDPEVDLSRYATYSWKEGVEAGRAEVQHWIVSAINRELQGKGMRRVDDGSGELQLKSYVAGLMGIDLWGTFVRPTNWTWGIIQADARTMAQGALAVILTDAGSEQHVWIGIVSKGGTGDVKKKKVDKAVRKLFADFPAR